MGKYSSQHQRMDEPAFTIHPVWRGIGFLMILIVPIMSWFGSVELIKLGKEQGWPFIGELTGFLQLPKELYKTPYVSGVANYISSIPDLAGLVLFFLIILLAFSGLLSLMYAILYRIVGPPRYSPLDAPASKKKVKRYTR